MNVDQEEASLSAQSSLTLPRGAASIFKRVTGSSLAYLVTNVIRAALPFLLIPFLTHYLTPGQYGIVALYQTLILFIVPLVPFNVNSAVTIEYYKQERDTFATYVTSCFVPPVLIGAALIVVLELLPNRMIAGLGIPRFWLIMSPLFGLSQLTPNVLLAIYQVENKLARFGAFSISMSALNVGLSVLFVAGFGWGWEGRLQAILLSQALFSVVALVLLIRAGLLRKRMCWTYVRDIVRYCAPLIPHSIGGTAIDIGDRIIVAARLGAAAVGQYTVAAQIGQILVLFVSSLNQAWVPTLYRELEGIKPRRKREVVGTTYALALVIVAAFIGLVLGAPVFAHMLVDRRYWLSLNVVPWIAAGYMFNGFYYLVANYIFFAKQTKVLAVLTFGNALASLALTYVGVRQFGVMGAAYATAASWAVFFIATWILAQKIFPMPWWGHRAEVRLDRNFKRSEREAL